MVLQVYEIGRQDKLAFIAPMLIEMRNMILNEEGSDLLIYLLEIACAHAAELRDQGGKRARRNRVSRTTRS